MLATVVWAAAVSVAFAVWSKELPIFTVLIAVFAVGWTLILPDDQWLTIAVPIIAMSVAARWPGRSHAGIFFLAMRMAANVDETA